MSITAEEVIRICADAIGGGFNESADREGWVFRCSECGNMRAGNEDGEHQEACRIGIAVKAIDDFLYSDEESPETVG